MFYFITIIIIVGLATLIIYPIVYLIPRKLGYKKTAFALTTVSSIGIITTLIFVTERDRFFTKNDAIEVLKEHKFILHDDFEILKNESMIAIGDYYHIISLKISKQDKNQMIHQIKSATNFKTSTYGGLPDIQNNIDRYYGTIQYQHFETPTNYVYRMFKPSGKKGYAPTYTVITISKNEDELRFEDIDE